MKNTVILIDFKTHSEKQNIANWHWLPMYVQDIGALYNFM